MVAAFITVEYAGLMRRVTERTAELPGMGGMYGRFMNTAVLICQLVDTIRVTHIPVAVYANPLICTLFRRICFMAVYTADFIFSMLACHKLLLCHRERYTQEHTDINKIFQHTASTSQT